MPWVWSDDFKDLIGEPHPPLETSVLSHWAEHPIAYAVREDQDVSDFIAGLVRAETENLDRG